jgi:hypothetical protein
MEAGDVLLNWKEWLLATDSMNPAALSEDLGCDLGCAVASQKVPGSIEKDYIEDIRPKLIALAMFRSTFQSDWEIC